MFTRPSMIKVPSWIPERRAEAFVGDPESLKHFEGYIGNSGDDNRMLWMHIGDTVPLRKMGSLSEGQHGNRVASLLEAYAWLWTTCDKTKVSNLLALDEYNIIARMANRHLCMLHSSLYTGYAITVTELSIDFMLRFPEVTATPLLVGPSPFSGSVQTVLVCDRLAA